MAKFTYTTRKDGRLMKKITINGKPIYLYSNDPKDLEKQYIEAKHKKYQGLSFENGQVRLRQWGEKWYNINISIKDYNTRRNIRSLLDNHIYPKLGHIPLTKLKTYHIKEFKRDMIEQNLTSTCNRAISTTKRILNDAIENDLIQKNVAINVKPVKYQKLERKPLSLYEDALLIQTSKVHKYGLFFMILRYARIKNRRNSSIRNKRYRF